MSHPPHMTSNAGLKAVLLAMLITAGTGALAATDQEATEGDTIAPAAARGTAFTDALVPAPGELLLAQAGAAPDACTDGPCIEPGATGTSDMVAAADTRAAATPSPAAAPVRAGVDGKPAGIGSVPEPQTYSLLCGGLGLLGIGARMSRRRRQSK
ncbi:PEP-CTERM sorting domain-containing protein [Massilia sp. TN1-12]|uniref:PEP-CTERM sorting domain-containing protein n=1 Tax=Massilia paldalensis TaxID=3377675 RepID=UPI00384D6313